MIQVAPTPLRVVDFLPIAGALVTVVLGHILTNWRNASQEQNAQRRAATERLERDLSSAQKERQFWRERAQSYRTEVYVLRALVGNHASLPPRTPDHDYEESE